MSGLDHVQKRVLILTLYCGENQYESCRSSVEAQEGVSFEHRIFENLPNAEAHRKLYEAIRAESESFDLFVKLDADMVLADVAALRRIVGYFEAQPDLDHLVLGVADWFTDEDIIGIHAFSRRASWEPSFSGLFTDPDPIFPGRKLVVRHPRPTLVDHASNPSPFQSFFFGVHRAVKACQPGLKSADKRPFGARTNWRTLVRVWRHFRRRPDARLGLAISGADLVLRGEIPLITVNRDDPAIADRYLRVQSLSVDELRARLDADWSCWTVRQFRWFRAMGIAMTVRVTGRMIRDALTYPVREMRHLSKWRIRS